MSVGYTGPGGDTNILRGFSALANRDQIAHGLDLDEIERALVEETPVPQSQDQLMRANRLIRELSSEYGVQVDDVIGDAAAHNTPRQSPYPSAFRSTPPRTPTVLNNMSDDDDTPQPSYGGRFAPTGVSQSYSGSSGNGGGSSSTGESRQNNTMYDAEIRARMEDEKAGMLADIGEIRATLEATGTPLDAVGHVDSNSTYEEIAGTLLVLQKKVDRERGSTLAQEMICLFASAAEEIFDGHNQWLGYSPNLSGLQNATRVKLRRVRHETGQIVNSVLQQNSIGPVTRLLMELFPTVILTARKNNQHHNQPSMFDDASMTDTNTRLGRDD